nr:S phase cyclin A associated protein in the [Hymenolepis microstoma]
MEPGELFSNTFADLLTSGKPRVPGRGVQMHEKLLSQNRGRCGKSIQEIEAKQARARFLRQRHLLERSNRVRELGKKVEEVRKQKLRLIQQRRNFLEKRLLMAEKNRRAELERRILKAHDEEIKGREIAFIQSLEAEQKQHTIFAKHEISCARLKERAENRRRRLEEKAEREEAAKLRRIELEALRLARLDELQARWLSRAHEIEARGERTRLVRRAAAREREAHREMKLAALEQQQRQHIEALRSKILRKQRECERRHQETLSGIRRKALEMATPQQYDSATTSTPLRYGNKNQRGWCRLCHLEVDSPGHFDSQGHRTALLISLPACLRRADRWDIDRLNAACFVEIPVSSKHSGNHKEVSFHLHRRVRSTEVERQRLLVKRLNIIRQRVNARSLLYRKAPLENPKLAPTCRQKAQSLVKEARRYSNLPESGPWVSSRVAAMEKVLHAIRRLANDEMSLLCCFHLDLTSVLVSLIDLTLCQRYFDFPMVPSRTVNLACGLLKSLCENVSLVPWHLFFNGDLPVLIDCITVKLARLDAIDEWGELKGSVSKVQQSDDIECIRAIFSCLLVISKSLKLDPPPLTASSVGPTSKKASSFTAACLTDFVAYAVNSGLMEVLTNYLSSPNLSAQLESSAGEKINTGLEFTLLSLDLLTAFVRLIPPNNTSLNEKSKISKGSSDDPTFLFDAVAATEVFGVVSLLYDTLQMSPNHRPGDCHDNLDVIGHKLQSNNGLADIVLSALKLINHTASINLSKIQEVVCNDTTSIQIRHILSLLFSVCAPSEDVNKPVKDISSPILATVAKATPSATSGGCLAGKRRRHGSALIPSGAKEVGVKVMQKAGLVSNLPTSASSEYISLKNLSGRSMMVEILHEAIVCLGYLTLGHFENQTRLCVSGQTTTPLLLQLCQLPLSYFSQPQLADILFPTLIASCFATKDVASTNRNTNVALLASHLNPALLANFVEARSLEKTLATPTDKKSKPSHNNNNDDYHRFENRFPPSLWQAAKSFFAEAKNQTSKSNSPTTIETEKE